MRRSKNHQLSARLCIGLAILALGLDLSAAPASGTRLVATTGTGRAGPSTLYEIDPVTGATLGVIGPVGYIVNGMEYDPTTGKLYGSTSIQDPSYNGLIEIDLTTGAGTPVGVHQWGGIPTAPNNCTPSAVSNITLDASGQMYGWLSMCDDDLVRIDKTTGIATWVGDATISTLGNGLDFDNSDALYMIQFRSVYAVSVTTGLASYVGTYGPYSRAHHGDFDPATNLYYAIGPNAYESGNKFLEVADLATMSVVATPPLAEDFHVLTFVGCGDESDPIAWWQFDEDSDEDGASGSVVLDSTANGNDGHLWNGASRVPSPFGITAALLDGVNDYVNVGSKSILDNLQAFTYSAWVYPTAFGDREIFSKRNSTKELRFKGAGTLRGCVIASGGNACSNSVETVPLGTWTHVAMTHDHAGDRKVHLYIDGVEVGYASQSTASGMMASDAPNPQLLGRRQNKSRPFAGMLDEMMIFDTALPECRIAQLAEPYPTCRTVNGLNWCYNDLACGEACNDVCAALGLTPVADDGVWFAAQDTPAECQAINDAFGLAGTVFFASYAYACGEDTYGAHTVGGGLLGPLFCSSFPGCPAAHRTNMDQLGIPCGPGSRRSVCPCE